MASGPLPFTAANTSIDAGHTQLGNYSEVRERARVAVTLSVKRALDILVGAVLLLLLLPLLLLIAVVVMLDSPGPALYVQRRAGRGGQVFRFYKFRSMDNDVDHTVALRQFCKEYINGQATSVACGDDTVYKPPTNGRHVTRVGHWLRTYSLDELPQLVNVLRGDMSLVGPRPSMDFEVEEYSDWHRKRLTVLPGITGLAQINGRSALAFDDIVRYDIRYIDNVSLWRDLQILLKTVPVVVRARAAR
jgi:lipopolysaccharide/colanic/teichoic acid biosynthesis glycosyltransferase